MMKKCSLDSPLISPPSLLPVYSAKSSDIDLALHHRVTSLRAATCSPAFFWPIDGANDLRIAHLEVRASIGSVLGGALAVDAP